MTLIDMAAIAGKQLFRPVRPCWQAIAKMDGSLCFRAAKRAGE